MRTKTGNLKLTCANQTNQNTDQNQTGFEQIFYRITTDKSQQINING